MQRFFVICLILLLPHKMFAAAMAAPAVQIADEQQHAFQQKCTASYLAVDCAGACDIDPDEPPAGADFHDFVNQEAVPPIAMFPELAVSPVTPPPTGRSCAPLFRPPRA